VRKSISNGRRNFLKTSVIGAANVMASGVIGNGLRASPYSNSNKIVINEDIDNLRVVCCHDPKMVTGTPKKWETIAHQNEFIDFERVQNNLDRMAMELAQKKSPKEAWSVIFKKPPSKQWSQVRAAIKANCKTNKKLLSNNPRIAVLDKICRELNGVGVPFGNIVIYDGDDEEASRPYKGYIGNGLPAGIIVSRQNDQMGGIGQAPIPEPWNKSDKCTKDIATGSIDILVNCTTNKGSHSWTGGVTLSMKNHYGTFGLGRPAHNFNYLIGINKSEALIGGTPPRQQLCIIDSIWASIRGPAAVPNKAPYKLVMGAFSPVIDYLTIKQIREKDMNATHNNSIISKYLTEFGYKEGDVSDFIYVDADATDKKYHTRQGNSKNKKKLLITTPLKSSRQSIICFEVKNSSGPIFITVRDVSGRMIRELTFSTLSSGELHAFWDGNDVRGSAVGSGTYFFTVSQNGQRTVKKLSLIK
jgi:hypothetical protein